MPVIKSAKKKLRQDRKREKTNDGLRKQLKDSVKKAQKTKNPKDIQKAFQSADKAAKNRIIHKNKAGHIKSSLSKLIKSEAKTETKTPVKTIKKKAAKSTK